MSSCRCSAINFSSLFDARSHMEYPLEDVRHNFFTREFHAVAKGLGVSINGKIRNKKLVGKIDHDGFGNIGTIEVQID